MECVLQWIDELDDVLASLLFVWHRVSSTLLVAGLIAAALVHSGLPAVDAYLLAQAALLFVLAWGLGGLLATVFERRTLAT